MMAFRTNSNKKTKETIRHECRMFRLKISETTFAWFNVLSRLTFWTLRLSRVTGMTVLQMMRKISQIVRYIRTFLYIILILIVFNRWFYWWWNTYRKWVGDPKTYLVECHAKWRRHRWFLCWNLRTISVSQDDTHWHCRGYYWPP